MMDAPAPNAVTTSTSPTPSDKPQELTPELILHQCRLHQGYTTPELNAKLYLHHLNLASLSPAIHTYTGCTVLYLTHNFISDLSALHPLVCLHSLFLAHNVLASCDSLPPLPSLRQLDIAHNHIRNLDGVAHNTPYLETLLASHNYLEQLKIPTLTHMSALMSLDVSFNKLERVEDALPALEATPSLRTCICTGNSFIRSIPAYRKVLIHALPSLRFLDELPVFPEERERAEAFAAGGSAAERAARLAMEEREEATRAAQFRFFEESQEGPRAVRAERGNKTEASEYLAAHAAQEEGPIYVPNAPWTGTST